MLNLEFSGIIIIIYKTHFERIFHMEVFAFRFVTGAECQLILELLIMATFALIITGDMPIKLEFHRT